MAYPQAPPRPSAKRLLLILLAIPAALVALNYGAKYWLLRSVMKSFAGPPLPKSLETPRVFLAKETLTKRVFASLPRIGEVTDVREVAGDVVAAGMNGVSRLDGEGRARADMLRLDMWEWPYTIVPDGKTFAILAGGMGARLLDDRGTALWRSTASAASAAGALAAGEPPVVALGYPGGGGVELRARDGRVLWKVDAANPWQVEIGEIGSGRVGVVHSSARGTLLLRDRRGNAKEISPETYTSHFKLLRWPGHGGRPAALVGDRKAPPERRLLVAGLDGTTVARLEAPAVAPEAEDLDVRAARYVSLKGGSGAYLAVVATVGGSGSRCVLYLYDPEGRLVYAELLAQRHAPLWSIPRKDRPGAETLLLGAENAVTAYELP
ncbi:MAG: hypothetical protein HY059_09200 [Proteobacteria bacterium]|nr:hypothetical protein [Pseudomonadota bacterium]